MLRWSPSSQFIWIWWIQQDEMYNAQVKVGRPVNCNPTKKEDLYFEFGLSLVIAGLPLAR